MTKYHDYHGFELHVGDKVDFDYRERSRLGRITELGTGTGLYVEQGAPAVEIKFTFDGEPTWIQREPRNVVLVHAHPRKGTRGVRSHLRNPSQEVVLMGFIPGIRGAERREVGPRAHATPEELAEDNFFGSR